MHSDGVSRDNRILQAALDYRRQGFSVIPLWSRQKEPALPGGTIARYREQAASEHTLRRWFGREERNLGIITGAVSRLLVLDVDGDEGRQSVRGLQMPPSPTGPTADGHHVYFRHPGGHVGSAIRALPGVDVLAENRYVVAPPSSHPEGPIYEWQAFLPLACTDLAPPPRWLIDILQSLGKIQPASTLSAPPTTHASVGQSQFLPHCSLPSPGALPGGASKPHMLLLAPPAVDGEVSERFREIAQQPDVAVVCARVLGIPVDTIGTAFRCILPGHREQRPSASLHWDSKTGVLKYRDWHRRSGHEWLSLPEVRASLAYGKVMRLRGPSVAVWQLRLLVEAGILTPAAVQARRLPATIRPAIRRVYEGFLLLLGCKWLHTPAEPTAFSWRFAAGWCGVTSMATIGEAMQWLLAHRFIRQVGVWKGAALFLPVQSDVRTMGTPRRNAEPEIGRQTRMKRSYQVLPPLSAEEYAALKDDIAQRGVQVPVEYDQEGHILDGFHRVQICQELGLDWPRIVRPGLTEAQKLEHAWRLNLARRHLTREQKQAIAVGWRQEGWTQERIAQALAVTQGTISTWLNEFINTNKLPEPSRIERKDGKRYPARKARPPSKPAAEDTDAAENAGPASSRLADTRLRRTQADGLEGGFAVSPPDVEWRTTSVAPLPPMAPDRRHQAIESTPEPLTNGAESRTAPNEQSPHHEFLDQTAGHWLRAFGALYAALRRLDDRQDLMTIDPSWSQQMRADYLRRCTYVISKLKVMQQTLQTTVADEGTPHHREESCRTLEGSSVTPTRALGDRREEEDDAPAPVMNPKEHDHGSLSYDPIRCHRPLRTADTVSGPWETGEATLGGPQAAAVGTVSPETSGPRGAQEARHERREEASEIEIGPPGRVAVIQEEGIGTDGRVRDHRQDVMARVKALRAEQRSMRDIPAIPNAEGVATFTGQG